MSPFFKIIPSAALVFLGLSVGFTVPAQAADLIYKDSYFDYSLPDSVTKVCYSRKNYNCPDISVKYAKTSQDWINNSLNNRINQLLPGPQAGYQPEAGNRSGNLSDQDKRKLLDGFAAQQLKEIPEDSTLNYQFEVAPSYLGHIGDVELFEINSYIYLGGAHGLGNSEYKMFNVATKKELKLEDLLVSGQQTKFQTLAYTAYKDWVKQTHSDPQSFEKNWPFSMTDNAIIDNEGIALTYQPYEIAPFAFGMPTLIVPYAKLKGIVKPEYLPKPTIQSQ
ncbi:RsiV family protein [Psychrobacter phenylpyruvicus]|uniref:Protein of uncharacterized function (DUF3298) n=1 Tax=Psychrobacter phenylpyruvicus TaxID=29432 RepID=A0A379LJF8_9GAMM|nr:RsiV family protein [Psychrobacter phenylpyruvicus]SUD89914.1 Protein of uncharacterised function (DUF3298) [Psychrobacter phenylpyruvicus]